MAYILVGLVSGGTSLFIGYLWGLTVQVVLMPLCIALGLVAGYFGSR